MSNELFENVWDAIEDSPAQAEDMKLRSSLMMALRDHIEQKGWTEKQAAQHLLITQPDVASLIQGKIGMFTADSLTKMLAAAKQTDQKQSR